MSNYLEYFGLTTDPIVGLDISSTAIKVLQLSQKEQQYCLECYAIEQNKPGAVVEKSIKDSDAVAEVIHRAMEKAHITSKSVSISVPSSLAVTKLIQVDADLTAKEIEAEALMEASRYVPYEMEDVNLDYQVLGTNRLNTHKIDVLLAAAKKEHIESRLATLEKVGLTAKVLDIDIYCIERAFGLITNQLPEQGEGKIIAVIDIGANITVIHVFKDGRIIYDRDQTFGGQQLMDEIQNRYGLSYEEALLARKFSDLPDDYVPEVLNPFIDTVAQQVNRACQLFFSSGEYSHIDYIVLTGGTSSIQGLDQVIQEKSGIKTFIANPFTDMNFAPQINQQLLMADAPSLLNCCGLALRNFDT